MSVGDGEEGEGMRRECVRVEGKWCVYSLGEVETEVLRSEGFLGVDFKFGTIRGSGRRESIVNERTCTSGWVGCWITRGRC